MFQTSWNSRSRWTDFGAAEDGLDRGVVTGLCTCGLLILVGVILGGASNPFASPISLMVVFGGTLGATCIHFSLMDVQKAYLDFLTILHVKQTDPRGRIAFLVNLAQRVRKEGPLVLEEVSRSVRDPFLKVALDLAVDTPEPEELRRTLEIEVHSSLSRSARPIQVFETMGTYAPALGLIGTLIGLIHMLGALNDPSTVGPAMGVALITTLYGAVLSNMLFLPVAGKLRNRAEEEALVKSVTIEGVICLARQDNPIVVEQKLQTFMPLQHAA
jgi:chemotaxis protein MotA